MENRPKMLRNGRVTRNSLGMTLTMESDTSSRLSTVSLGSLRRSLLDVPSCQVSSRDSQILKIGTPTTDKWDSLKLRRVKLLESGEEEIEGFTLRLLESLGLITLSVHRDLIQDLRTELRKTTESERVAWTDSAALSVQVSSRDEEIVREREKRAAIEGRVSLLETENAYLKEQVKIYQIRLGLIVVPRDQNGSATEHKPIRKTREPFEALSHRVSKAQTDRLEKYWKDRAAATNITGKTTSEDPGVKEENDTSGN